MSWFYSWLPELPNLNFNLNLTLPTSIQGRFLSFVLKKTLGKFFKPGQLDTRQIDSQIGSGFVQVNDLELEHETINNLLVGLPIVLRSGTLSSATVRIPWPNPLTSTLGFSLNSLHLAFEVASPPTVSAPDVDLASSVASVAETFLHEELTPREGASLLDSLHSEFPDTVERDVVPGGLDPFDADVGPEARSGAEPGGISLLATLIERLLSRFEFDARDIRVTIVHPDNVSLTLTLSELKYSASIKQTDAPQLAPGNQVPGVDRSLAVNGICLQMKDVRGKLVPRWESRDVHSPRLFAKSATYECASQSNSPHSSSSSIDEETMVAMSQSLASLPPRIPSSQSIDNSMYQSALSAIDEESATRLSDPSSQSVCLPPHSTSISPSRESPDETVFSSSTTPITFRMITVPPAKDGGNSERGDEITFTLKTGLWACACRPWHIRGLAHLANTVASGLPASPPRPLKQGKTMEGTASPPAFNVKGSLDHRGIAALLLPSNSKASIDDLQHFFLHPLIPPRLPSGSMRIHVEGVAASLNFPLQKRVSGQSNSRSNGHIIMNGTFAVHNIDIFVFRRCRVESVSAFPLLFMDPHLPNQYPTSHHHPVETDGAAGNSLPQFDIVDWTNEEHQKKGAARLSYWRCRPTVRQQMRHNPTLPAAAVSPSPPADDPVIYDRDAPALKTTFEKSQKREESAKFTIQGTVTPIHLLVDLDNIIGDDTVMEFLEEATRGINNDMLSKDSSKVDALLVDDTPLSTPRMHPIAEPEVRVQHSIHDRSGLEYDYEDMYTGAHGTTNLGKRAQPEDGVHFSLSLVAVRLELRAPSPHSFPRSGALVFDFHNIEFRDGPQKAAQHPHFTNPALDHSPDSTTVDGQPLFWVNCRRIGAALSLVGQATATAFLSLGPLSDHDVSVPGHRPPLQPRASVTRSQANSGVITALAFELPSAHVVIAKDLLDAMQYFVDDASQLFERFSQRMSKQSADTGEGEDVSLIGSHFFSRSGANSTSAMMNSTSSSHSETVFKVIISEAFLRAWVPRADTEMVSIRPFDICASELNALVELKPEGKEETVVTLGIWDIKLLNVFKSGKTEALLRLTALRSMSITPRPLIKLRFISAMSAGSTAKETRVKLTMCDFTCNIFSDMDWVEDLESFIKSPPGTFEAVIPSEHTGITLKIMDGTVRMYAPTMPGAVILYAGDFDLATNISGKVPESTATMGIQYLSLLAIDDVGTSRGENIGPPDLRGVAYLKRCGYALVAEVADTKAVVTVTKAPPVQVELLLDGVQLHLHLAADTLNSLSALISDIASSFTSSEEPASQFSKDPVMLATMSASRNLMASVEDIAFQRLPEIGPAPDMIYDDLPTNRDYLDESFGAAAGLRALSDDELDDLDDNSDGGSDAKNVLSMEVEPGGIFNFNGETIKVHPDGVNIIEEHFDNIPAEQMEAPIGEIESQVKVRIQGGDATLFLYDGYDWVRTRKVIEEEVKEMRRRLAKIRQLVANDQLQDFDMEEANTVLFNSVFIGLDQNVDVTEADALLEAIDEELKEDVETATQSSWQSLRPTGIAPGGAGKPQSRAPRVHGKKLTRSKGPSMEFKLMGLNLDVDRFFPNELLVSKSAITVRDIEILDHIKTSTWKKFLTALRSDSRGNIRETDSNMVKIELRGVRPAPGHPSEESRVRAKILPLRLYVDQDAVDFLKKFFSFKDPQAIETENDASSAEAYIQLAEIFSIDLKLDYKPRRVDYRALREGRTIELMNFFHFDGAEMTLRHITLAGVTGWPRLFEMLNDLWTPDVKATQLVDVISGVAPIRSMVNVGSGVADLVLLPISQYKKDGRIVRGMQKGATAFVKSTAIEAIKLGARLATGTQVILEQAENVLGGSDSYMTETVQVPTFDDAGQLSAESDEESGSDLISKYAEQPMDVREGFQSAYRSLRRNLNSAAQTILAVPMEAYERSGDEGPVRSVIRAVPIAVLKPMIGASEAISQTLLGLHNTLDPNVRRENEAKYKHR